MYVTDNGNSPGDLCSRSPDVEQNYDSRTEKNMYQLISKRKNAVYDVCIY